jgi:hypothetical protein
MARGYSGGSWNYSTLPAHNNVGDPLGSICFKMKCSTGSGTGWVIVARSASTSSGRDGITLHHNTGAPNKLTMWALAGAGQFATGYSSTTSINDGNWHSVGIDFSIVLGGTNRIYIDGALENTAISAFNWPFGTNLFVLGSSESGFFNNYSGELAEVAFWQSIQLSADDHAAYHKGFRPNRIRPQYLVSYSPLVRGKQDLLRGTMTESLTPTETTHPRVSG